mgnify:CR=1 FL=1|jgi:hypothetical protein|tara:strand:- start:20 stop:736 length:717 start_codon:yes stop_codon:yes gene_type:complete
MATTTATITINSTDLVTDELSLSSSSTLTNAGGSTGVTQTTGLARRTTSAAAAAGIQAVNVYRAGDYTANGANKVYIKNTSATAAEFFTVHIDQEEIGRLYAGDWMFMPWNATSGTKAVFTVTIAATWAAGDTWEFDGVTMTAADSTTANIAAQIDALNYPNWTTTHVATESTIIFTARYASSASEEVWVTADGTLDTAGNGTANISAAAVGSKSQSDITIRPSVHTAMTYESLLIHE